MVNGVACAAPEIRRLAATQLSQPFFITRLLNAALQRPDYRTPPSPMIVYGAQNNGCA